MNSFPKYALQTPNSEQLLRKSLAPLRKQFDFILIDTPPSLKFFTLNALIASDCVVITTQCAYLSMHGVEQIERLISAVRSRTGKPKEPKLLLTLYDENSAAMQAVMGTLAQRYANRILSPIVPLDEAVQEAQILRKPLFDHAPQGSAAQAYLAVAKALSLEYCQ
jgi:chromosome partitioning protein